MPKANSWMANTQIYLYGCAFPNVIFTDSELQGPSHYSKFSNEIHCLIQFYRMLFCLLLPCFALKHLLIACKQEQRQLDYFSYRI